MCSKFSMLMPVAYWLLHGGVSFLMSEIWEMSPCKNGPSYHFVAWFAHWRWFRYITLKWY